ncbi:MAG: LacI family DNA-binding transcriptional regulator [Candidatus Dormibacteria bacterium]
MKGPATLRDVAKAAGVHPGTASRALNPDRRHLVRSGTAERVLEAAQALDFQPDLAARSLKTRRSYAIGVLIPDLNNPLFPPIVRGIEDALNPAGYVALLGNTDNDDARERRIFDSMRSRNVDGFIFATARHRHPLIDRARREQLPVVLVNRVLEGSGIPSASVDDQVGVGLAVEHLAELGHSRILHLAGPQDLSTGRGRLRGFRAGMRHAGLAVDPDLVVVAGGFSQKEGARCLGEVLERGVEFTAVVAGNDLLALGCYSALNRFGLDCPRDISVVGFNDMPFIDQLRPPLTSVHIPHYHMGAEAGRLVLAQLAEEPSSPPAVYLPPQLAVRGSTAHAPAGRLVATPA